jgi:hypothetical protein
MSRDFFDPTPEQQNVVLIDAATVQKAQRMIAGCEACSEDAELPFENILDRLTGSDPSVTDYVLEAPAKCLRLRCGDHRKNPRGVGCRGLSPSYLHVPSRGHTSQRLRQVSVTDNALLNLSTAVTIAPKEVIRQRRSYGRDAICAW